MAAGVGVRLAEQLESGSPSSSPSGDAAAVAAFLFALLLLSLLGGAVAAAALFSRRGYQRPLNVFVLSVLSSDLLLVFTAIPMQVIAQRQFSNKNSWNICFLPQAIRMSSGVSEGACLTWMYLELAAVASRSWVIPAVVLLYYLHDGLIPMRRYEIQYFENTDSVSIKQHRVSSVNETKYLCIFLYFHNS